MDAGSSVPAKSDAHDEPGDAGRLTVEVDEETQRQILELETSTKLPTSHIVQKAILALYRSWICDPLDPKPKTGLPFKKRWSDNDAHVVLRQLDGKTFRMAEGFRYKGYTVNPHWVTDLASVPGFLTWLVPRYGRHSLPALLHDCLIEKDTEANEREKADDVFREAMNDTGVPFVRRWVMWAGVRLATQTKRSEAWKALVVLWGASYFIAALALLVSLLGDPSLLSWLAVFTSPLLLSFIWTVDLHRSLRFRGERYWMGLITAYTILVIAAPSVLILFTLGLYVLAERVAGMSLSVLGRSDKAHPLVVKDSKATATPEGAGKSEPCLERSTQR